MIRKLIYSLQRCIWVAVLPIFLIGCGLQAVPPQNSSSTHTKITPSSSVTSADENKPSNINSSSYDPPAPPAETPPSSEETAPVDGSVGSSQASSQKAPDKNASGSSVILQSSGGAVLPLGETPLGEAPIVKSAVLKQGIPDGFVAPPGEDAPEGTLHIEVLVKNTTPQMYKFILTMDDIPQPIVVRAYKSTSHPSQGGDNICLSQPFQLTPEVVAALISNPNAKISLNLVAIYGKEDFSAPSDPLFLDESKERFLPAKP